MYRGHLQTASSALSVHRSWQHSTICMLLVHSPHLVGHQQLFTVLTQSSSLGAGEMSCWMAVWVAHRQSDTCRWFNWLLRFEIRSNLWMGKADSPTRIQTSPLLEYQTKQRRKKKEKKKKTGREWPEAVSELRRQHGALRRGCHFLWMANIEEERNLSSSPQNSNSSLFFHFKQILFKAMGSSWQLRWDQVVIWLDEIANFKGWSWLIQN